MTDTIELLRTIGDVRRDMPRNQKVMTLLDALEKMLTQKPAAKSEDVPSAAVGVAPSKGGARSRPATSGFDKTAWMRVYMRQRRAKAKAKTKVKRK